MCTPFKGIKIYKGSRGREQFILSVICSLSITEVAIRWRIPLIQHKMIIPPHCNKERIVGHLFKKCLIITLE